MRGALWLGMCAVAMLGCGRDAPSIPRATQRCPAMAKESDRTQPLSALYSEELARCPELTFAELETELGLQRATDRPLSFDPTTARHFDVVAKQLQLTQAEIAVLRQRGFVSVDHGQPYSMASIYFTVYARDMPVLITTDSVLHALHRSYEEILKDLEQNVFIHVLARTLEATHGEIDEVLRTSPPTALATALRDVDLYVTVARNLLAGAGSTTARTWSDETWDGTLYVPSKTRRDREALSILKRVASLEVEVPANDCSGCTRIYGGVRPVDWSQFRVRGHYDDAIDLRWYFRAMMWLGRPDLGFNLTEPPPASGPRIDVRRERRAAAAFALLLRQSGELGRLQAVRRIVDFMVGRADDVSVDELLGMLDRSRVAIGTLADAADNDTLSAELAHASKQQIRGQTLMSMIDDPIETLPPVVFQIFGQQFLIDSYVLSRVVFDSIVYHREKQQRVMPKGLDVMAALGNDEAVALLEPDLRKHNYGANLRATRHAVNRYAARGFEESAYGMWLDALRKLGGPLPSTAGVPEAMRTGAWQRKMLQTQHASWAELRHDTVLYGKQSYGDFPGCGYPDVYIEPYPAFYARLESLARRIERDLGTSDLSHPDPAIAAGMEAARKRQRAFWARFSGVMSELSKLAKAALQGKAFTDRQRDFLKKTIDRRGGGSGPPRYDGWYGELFYEGGPNSLVSGAERWEPTVADVHTCFPTEPGACDARAPGLDPRALEVAVGGANFLVLAVDARACGGAHSVYVGPAYTYYEFSEPAARRLTDYEWRERIASGNLPKRPDWVAPFAAQTVKRSMARQP